MPQSSRHSITLSLTAGIVAGVIVAIIFYLMPHKTTGQVFILLLLLFVLPSVLIWFFWPLKRYGWLRVVITLILAFLVITFGYYVWPSDGPTLVAWLAQKANVMLGLPWYWFVVIGSGVGIPFGMALQHRGRTLIKERVVQHLQNSNRRRRFAVREIRRLKADLATAAPPPEPAEVGHLRAEIQRLTSETETLKTQFSESQREARTLDVDLRGKKQQMKEVERERERYKGELGKSQEDVQKWKNEYDEEHTAALRLMTSNDQFKTQIAKLTSDADEARREKLDAAGNLHGVETDRNNYRTWYNELAWLNPSIKPQKEDISNYIKVIAARPCLLNLTERFVIIDLVIRNDSFFDIRIKPGTVAGQLSTNKKGLLHDPAKAFVDLNHLPIENLKPTKEAMFAIKQPLLRTEAEEIEDAIAKGSDGYFWLGSLSIPISVQNAEPLDVDSQPLRMNSDVEHVYFREFGSLTFNGEVITPPELLRDVEALPFPERARIYRELSKAYGESLWRLNEAEEKKDPEELANEAISRNTNNA